MKSLKKPLLFAVLSACVWVQPAFSADSKAGEKTAENCAGCHGAKGQSNNPQAPHLAGQQAGYIAAQLNAFKSGERKNSTMQAMAANLSETDIENVAAYFSGLPAAKAGGDAALAKTGKDKAGMCLGCHGSNAEGRGMFPRLAGQNPDYLVAQLKSFKDGTRTGGPMPGLASSLSDDDMKAIAAYLGSL